MKTHELKEIALRNAVQLATANVIGTHEVIAHAKEYFNFLKRK